jgi:hypothetical protein
MWATHPPMKGTIHPAQTVMHDLFTIFGLTMDGHGSLFFIRTAGNRVQKKDAMAGS